LGLKGKKDFFVCTLHAHLYARANYAQVFLNT